MSFVQQWAMANSRPWPTVSHDQQWAMANSEPWPTVSHGKQRAMANREPWQTGSHGKQGAMANREPIPTGSLGQQWAIWGEKYTKIFQKKPTVLNLFFIFYRRWLLNVQYRMFMKWIPRFWSGNSIRYRQDPGGEGGGIGSFKKCIGDWCDLTVHEYLWLSRYIIYLKVFLP